MLVGMPSRYTELQSRHGTGMGNYARVRLYEFLHSTRKRLGNAPTALTLTTADSSYFTLVVTRMRSIRAKFVSMACR